MAIVSEKQKLRHAKYLAEGERIIKVFGVGRRYLWFSVLTYFPLAFLLIGMPKLLEALHLWHAKTYIFTDRRVIIKDGIFSIKTTSAPYDKITHITVREDFMKKLCYGIGDITIHTAAAGPQPIEIDIIKVEEPMKIKNLLEQLMTAEKHGTI